MASKIRKELEEQRNFLHEKLLRVEFDLKKHSDYQTENFQKLSSKKRKLIKDINLLTEQIEKIKELDKDPKVKKLLDEKYDNINSLNNNCAELLNEKPKIKSTEFDVNDYIVDEDIKNIVEDFLNSLNEDLL